ncbi:probable tRNA sulfurtransferase [Clostridium sp. CAG:1000]|jgi:thiamine biosynthesis protein ThiI|nr:probable tRNA sulfurtransferase [Clostridium sp. CAG:1000]
MKRIILIKYGELTTKKDNRGFFIKTLRKNILNKLTDYNIEIKDDYYRMFIYCEESDIDKIISILKSIFGIHEIVICISSTDTSTLNIKNISLDIMKNKTFKTFKVETNRSDKSYPIKSMEINNIIGGHILKNINCKVDVHNPDYLLNIEIRCEGVYIYENRIKGLGGYPVSTLGRGLLMLSGGIDSPVAGYLTIKRGVELYYLYFESRPHTSIEARNKVITLARKLEKYNSNGKLLVVNFTKIQEAIYKNLDPDYLITIMRRMMYRIAQRVAKKNKCLAIVNGESIGQVASQTLSSILSVNDVTNFPILRPLCSFDKLDIIDIAKKIDTYETSILPYEDCCTVFVPKHPVINPNLKHIYHEESLYDFSELLDEAVNNIEIVDLKEVKSDLL